MLQNPNEITPNNIWSYKQNHPELVIQDIGSYMMKNRNGFNDIPALLETVRNSLLARGINKWLKVRRDLIAYKKIQKHRVRELTCQLVEIKKAMEYLYISPKNVNKSNFRQYVL